MIDTVKMMKFAVRVNTERFAETAVVSNRKQCSLFAGHIKMSSATVYQLYVFSVNK